MMRSVSKMVSPAPDPKTLFKDLGRPTLRGVRKCPNCGIYNGIRGLSCKNKDCNMVLRGKGRKGSQSADAVRIITGSTMLVYSVRVRDRGPDYRGFVELPLADELVLEGPDAEAVTISELPHCFIDSCQKGLSSDVKYPTACSHVSLAQKCTVDAQPLTLKNSVLNSLQVSNEIKQEIWLLATETTGPLVQRVSKNTMVVKSKSEQKYELGFLHFSFTETPKKKGAVEHKYSCACRQDKNFKHSSGDNKRRCVHFYACICAFASDDVLAKEFAYFINLDSTGLELPVPSPGAVQITIIDGQVTSSSPDNVSMAITVPSPSKKRRKDDTLAQASSALLTLQEGPSSPVRKSSSHRRSGVTEADQDQSIIDKGGVGQLHDPEEGPMVSFTQWLGSLTERINQTMHYQFEGTPEPLVFHIPQVFFDILQQRISSGSRKKRLPNSTVAFIRKDALPLGTFTKYTWHLTNIIHVKQIFDTREMPLELTRSFVENKDGTFSCYVSPKVDVEHVGEAYRRTPGQIPIKPFELKTFLKVGNTSADQKEPTLFIIEWIPDILPKSRIGELRIKFEYGHQRNGHIERRVEEVQTAIEHVV